MGMRLVGSFRREQEKKGKNQGNPAYILLQYYVIARLFFASHKEKHSPVNDRQNPVLSIVVSMIK